ncbi:MAG: rod-binding protein [Methylocella sp.]
MSINPASDIVLDVARAADPSKALAATERLARIGSAAPVAGGFAGLVAPTQSSESALRSQIGAMSGRPAFVESVATGDDAKAYKGLEQLVLQRLVEAMLPKEESGVFGSGTAGDVWRSMLSEQLAKQLGKSVDLGLGKSTGGVTRAQSQAMAPPCAPAQQRS